LNNILRVFPYRTSFTPDDPLVAISEPTLWEPRKGIEEVHISILSTWDIEEGKRLQESWARYYSTVKLGGPAFGLSGDEFEAGKYIKRGVTITTRGCDFNCPWCLVPSKEGKFRELKTIAPGNIVQDNNILLANKIHLCKLFGMLKTQKAIRFVGGLDCRLLKDWHIEKLRGLRIKELWFALDSGDRRKNFSRICKKLKRVGFRREQIRCYVLAGYDEPIQASETRLRFAYECGALPFIQPYQPPDGKKKMAGKHSREDNLFVWQWSRPAAIKAMM